ncbi:hypothetical protein H1235_07940 [Pseudoxanthomonas sp. NC8]|nr:hypothetical protein H1235_07940 [Pseudoxanthomonas sp. NC8]
MAIENAESTARSAGVEAVAPHEEQALWVVEAALWMHRRSFGMEGDDRLKAEWLITSAMERAVQLLKADVYGEV